MHCIYCGTNVGTGIRFCPQCGKEQPVEPAAPAMTGTGTAPYQAASQGETRSGGNGAVYGGIAAVAAVALGVIGYWGYERHEAAGEAARKVAEMERSTAALQRQNAQATQVAQTAAAEASKAAEEAERLAIAVAVAALDKAIAQEEEQAKQKIQLTSVKR
jgi:uncharacterized protein HemX